MNNERETQPLGDIVGETVMPSRPARAAEVISRSADVAEYEELDETLDYVVL